MPKVPLRPAQATTTLLTLYRNRCHTPYLSAHPSPTWYPPFGHKKQALISWSNTTHDWSIWITYSTRILTTLHTALKWRIFYTLSFPSLPQCSSAIYQTHTIYLSSTAANLLVTPLPTYSSPACPNKSRATYEDIHMFYKLRCNYSSVFTQALQLTSCLFTWMDID